VKFQSNCFEPIESDFRATALFERSFLHFAQRVPGFGTVHSNFAMGAAYILAFGGKSVKRQMRSRKREIGSIFCTKRDNALLKRANAIAVTLKRGKIA
jgi:hypothetical protein